MEAHGADQQLVYVTHKEMLACDTSYQSFVDNDIAEGWAVLNKTKTEWSGCEGAQARAVGLRRPDAVGFRQSLPCLPNSVNGCF